MIGGSCDPYWKEPSAKGAKKSAHTETVLSDASSTVLFHLRDLYSASLARFHQCVFRRRHGLKSNLC